MIDSEDDMFPAIVRHNCRVELFSEAADIKEKIIPKSAVTNTVIREISNVHFSKMPPFLTRYLRPGTNSTNL
jgi:hypothetical protein